MPPEIMMTSLHLVGLDELKKRSGWFLALGVLLVVLGAVSLGAATFMTLASVVLFGALMIVVGILQTLIGLAFRRWGGFFVGLLAGMLSLTVGFLMVAHPGATAIALTLLIVVFLIFGGAFRIVLAIAVPFPNRAWMFLHGIINLVLGLIIWHDWPVSGLWVIGLFIGIDMIFNGWSLIMLGLAAKNLPGD